MARGERLKDEAIILTGYAAGGALKGALPKGGLKVAMSAGAMLALDSVGEEYLTFEDLYPTAGFRRDMDEMTAEIEGLFGELDRASETQAGFPRPYTANIYWFIVYLSNLLYLSRVAGELKARTGSQAILIGRFLEKGEFSLNPDHVRPESGSLTFQRYYFGLQNKVDLLASALGPGVVQTTLAGKVEERSLGLLHRASSLRNRARYLLTRTCREKAVAALAGTAARLVGPGKGRCIFIIQDKYEVRWLKRYLRDYRFVRPVEAIPVDGLARRDDMKAARTVQRLALEFARSRFPVFTDQVLRLFAAYHCNVVAALGSFSDAFGRLLARESPGALFYSIGAHNVIEEVCAQRANDSGIPVFYFQHGGGSAYTSAPYQKYFEENGNIEKIRIMRSAAEAGEAEERSSVRKAFGSITLHRLFSHPAPSAGRVLYLCSAFATHAYKDLMLTVPDSAKYGMNRDIIRSVAARGLEMDLKLSTVDERLNRDYFMNLVRAERARRIGVLHRIPAESIIGSYGLVIIDYLTSALTSVVLMLDVPVVCYLPDTSSVKPGFLDTLERRTYLVGNPADLDGVIERFSREGLDSRWMPELVDRYAFEREGGDPGPRIASYVRGVIETACEAPVGP